MPRSVPELHVITPAAAILRPDFPSVARDMQARCGARLALHLRAAELPARSLYTVAAAVSEGAVARGGWCVVNGRLDVALAARAQAVQLGRQALPVARARRVATRALELGASVHAVEEAVDAARDGANFLVLGTIHPTPSHPGREAAGKPLIRLVREALDAAGFDRIGIVAIGGIDAGNVGGAIAAGAAGVAVQRAVWDSEDPVGAAGRLVSMNEQRQEDG